MNNANESAYRELPACLDAERAALGNILLDGAKYGEASQLLKADDFFLDSHRRIFRAMTRLAIDGQKVDLVTVIEALRHTRELESVGGAEFVASLVDGVPDLPTISAYTALVKNSAHSRRLIHAMQAAEIRAFEGDPMREITSSLLDTVLEVGAESQSKNMASLSDVMAAVIREIETESRSGKLVGLPSGLGVLDQATGGFRAGELVVLGALPGRGKTSFACQILAANAEAGNPVGMFSVEMSHSDIVRRLLSGIGPVNAQKIRNPQTLDPEEWSTLAESAAELSKWEVYLDDTGNLDVADLVTRGKILASRGVKLLVIDHLQLVQAESRDVRERVSKVAEACRQIAKTEQIVVVLLSQLRRPQSANDFPSMLELKESGDIEAAAHVVILLHTPEDDNGRLTGEDFVIVGKNRNGVKGPLPVHFNTSDLRFYARQNY